jgi:hypothetical protein
MALILPCLGPPSISQCVILWQISPMTFRCLATALLILLVGTACSTGTGKRRIPQNAVERGTDR